jgi:citrate/tricarballylate utilization protein
MRSIDELSPPPAFPLWAKSHATAALDEADRIATICNSCRYCEGLCAVFPAMETRTVFTAGDLNYLANLCHGCGACYDDCQFSPPHEFAVNVPKAFETLRAESYQAYAWPRAFAPAFERNGLVISLVAAASVAVFVLGFVGLGDPAVLFTTQTGAGAFYRLMPHEAMVALFGAAFLYAIIAIAMGLRSFWRDSGGKGVDIAASLRALRDAGTLRYLDGGGAGCDISGKATPDRRRLYHHFTSYGFLLCLASTSVATLYHYGLGREAPYPWYDLPVLLGTAGGVGLIIGPVGLLVAKRDRNPALRDAKRLGMDVAFLVMLLLTSLTGLLLLGLRATPAMGILLALHLGVVFSLFVTMPYGKFVHGLYRFAALLRFAGESKARDS